MHRARPAPRRAPTGGGQGRAVGRRASAPSARAPRTRHEANIARGSPDLARGGGGNRQVFWCRRRGAMLGAAQLKRHVLAASPPRGAGSRRSRRPPAPRRAAPTAHCHCRRSVASIRSRPRGMFGRGRRAKRTIERCRASSIAKPAPRRAPPVAGRAWRVPDVVGVERRDEFSACASSGIARGRRPRLADAAARPRFARAEPFGKRCGLVARAVVDDQDFDLAAALRRRAARVSANVSGRRSRYITGRGRRG